MGITFLVYACVFMRIVDGRITLLGTLLFTFVAFEFVTLGQTPELQYITILDWLIFWVTHLPLSLWFFQL